MIPGGTSTVVKEFNRLLRCEYPVTDNSHADWPGEVGPQAVQLTWQELKKKVCSNPEITVEALNRGKGLGGKWLKSVKSGRIQSATPVTVIQNEPKPQSQDTHTETLEPAGPPRLKQGAQSVELQGKKVPLQAGQPLKFTVLETLDRNKEEFEFLQAQYHRQASHYR
ncbi:hypothetical protein JZ751_014104 [Albula glossodonta]|uniref:Uncharacterized protein n=1 Tax=Albula glossodonta TaxID=121402 RepID=A0A8T2P0G6_9TELE|nr:hypothetical protein JZ751_014104 [Albula glossodonta]